MTFPKWVPLGYGIGDVLCVNEDEEAAAIARREEIANPPEEGGPTVEELQTKLDDIGVNYDKRWGVKRLKKALADAG